MVNSACLYERQQMTIQEMICAVEQLQAIYKELLDEQKQAKDKVRWAITHLTDKIWMETL
jgi:hypothetical protein